MRLTALAASSCTLIASLTACKAPPAELASQVPSAGPQPLVIAESEPDPEPRAAAPRPSRRLPDASLRQLYACWLSSPYEYMFEAPAEREPALPIPTVRAGQFMAGVSGIMDYGSLTRCVGELNDTTSSSFSSLEPIEALAGMPIREEVHKHGYQPGRFNRYHPDIIRWGAEALVPDPGLEIVDGWTALELYHTGFSRFFRLMSHSYVDLLSRDALEADRDRYLAATASGGDGIEWLHTHYGGRLSEYGGFYDGTQMTAGMAYGFWLRRSDDGSADALWDGLRDFMRAYDGPWLAQLEASHPGLR